MKQFESSCVLYKAVFFISDINMFERCKKHKTLVVSLGFAMLWLKFYPDIITNTRNYHLLRNSNKTDLKYFQLPLINEEIEFSVEVPFFDILNFWFEWK